jgi:hypothetical protein
MADRREDLERAREVLWLAIDGDRQLQRNVKDGEKSTYTESAAGLIRELRAVTRELADLADPAEEVSVADDLARKREARIAGSDDSARTSRRSVARRSGRSNRTG